MRLLKSSNNFIQIVLMSWIIQAFMLGPQTWIRQISLKKQPNIQNIFSKHARKLWKNYFQKMNGHSKWSPNNFELDFVSIEINFLAKCLQKHFSQVLFSMQFLKSMILIFLDRSKCRAHSDMVSSIVILCTAIPNREV